MKNLANDVRFELIFLQKQCFFPKKNAKERGKVAYDLVVNGQKIQKTT